MPDSPDGKQARSRRLSDRIGAKETRKLRARRRGMRSIWLGFAASGLVGWSIVVPLLLGIGLGMWLDRHYPAKHSWTLTLLVAGLCLGCWNAWRWIAEEQADIRNEENRDEH